MTSTDKRTLEDALSLPEDESLPNDIAWAEEAVQRLEREARGQSKAIAWDEAKRQLKATHGFE